MKIFFRRRILKTLFFSISGLKAAWKMEEAFRVELIIAVILLSYIGFSAHLVVHKILFTLSVFIVLIVELINTALEKAIDRISLEQHELSKIVKDIGSAAVLLSIINFLVVWAYIVYDGVSLNF